MKSNADGAGQMIVASASGTQFAGCVRDKFLAGKAGQNTEAFEGAGDRRTFQAVKAVLTLMDDTDKVCGFQALQVHAGGGGTDAGHYSKFGAGARVAVHQTVEHAGARRFTNSCGDRRNGSIGVQVYIHTLMIDEAFLQGKQADCST